MCVCTCAQSCPGLLWPHELWPERLLFPWKFSGKKYWNEFSFWAIGDLSKSGIEPISLAFPALAGIFFTTSATWDVFVLHTSTRYNLLQPGVVSQLHACPFHTNPSKFLAGSRLLVCSGCLNRVPQTGCLKPQKLISSQFGMLDVQHQGVSRDGFWWDSSQLAFGHHLAVSSQGLFSVHGRSRCLFLSFQGY